MVVRGGCREWNTPCYGTVITLILGCGVLVSESWDSYRDPLFPPGTQAMLVGSCHLQCCDTFSGVVGTSGSFLNRCSDPTYTLFCPHSSFFSLNKTFTAHFVLCSCAIFFRYNRAASIDVFGYYYSDLQLFSPCKMALRGLRMIYFWRLGSFFGARSRYQVWEFHLDLG
ncbi:hypothetical protein ASPTUDRAFT_864318 [Aspergillus tubingensis CBS 134.48]|uniref:Uncharacterized protein n=1 Tax=Aspergillus tubingensis (strain CBS 134.48) TaxID=767770 RepID=A0A1L9MU91_ASPTC|nr:hypothetical protein ASPTUDRAFT_864318 [Aspergillus tubingensis CBS 134.48]